MDMEVDELDLDLDPVKNFLVGKLQSVRALKASTKETLTKLQEMLDERTKPPPGLRLLDIWTCTCDDRYVFQLKLENENDTPVKDLNVAMQWKPSTSPSYRVKLCSLDRTEIKKLGILVLIVERPSFAKHSKFEAQATLLYDSGGERRRLELPSIVLDVASRPIEVKNLDVVGGKFEYILARLSCLRKVDLVATLPERFARKLGHYLVVDCMLREVDFRGTKYFVFDGLSKEVDGCLVIFIHVEDVYELNIYYRTVESLHLILHHLHSNIDGINVLPSKYKALLIEEPTRDVIAPSQTQRPVKVNPNIASFAVALRKQVDETFDFHVNTLNCAQLKSDEDISDEYRILREFLTGNELECDSFYERLSL